jgi:hypothetical protein
MCSHATPELTDDVRKKMEQSLLRMARYLCGSSAPCRKHAEQARALWAIAADGLDKYVAQEGQSASEPEAPATADPEVIERSCTSKARYGSPAAAGRAAQRARNERGVTGLRVYPCAFCHGFHLTKESLEAFAVR